MLQPPPPPPPPPLFNAPTILPFRKRSPTHSDGNRNLSKTPTPRGKPSFGVHPETLQHAAASLRKTEHGQQILSCEQPTQLCERQIKLSPTRNWQNLENYGQLRQSSPREPILAESTSFNNSSTLRFSDRNPYLLGNSNTATSKYEEKFLQKPKTDDFYLTSNDNFLNKLNTSILSKSQQYKSNSISPTFNSNINQIPLSATNTTVTTDPLTKKQTTTTTYKYYSDGSGNVQNFKNNTYNFDKPYSNITTPSFENQQSLLNFKDNDTIIKDPKALIHEFATKTSISDIIEPCELENQLYKIPITNRNQREKSFAETLRDSSLTQSQKHSNKFQKSLLQDTPLPKSFNTFYQTNLSTKGTDELNDLIRDMQLKLSSSIDRNIVPENNKTSYSKTIGSDSSNFSATQYTTTYNTILNSRRTMSDNQTIEESKLQRNNYICNKCNQIIQPDRPGVTALGNFYHVECFVCEGCGKQLAGSSFYNVQGKCYCEVDYVNSLEKCLKCRLPIKQKILRALGGAYHPECFVCHNCEKSLDGVGFTTNKDNEPHCMHCFHEKYSPRCATCLKPIAPAHNETEVPRIIAMDKSYHVECYRCEDCGLQLNSKIEGQGCYPIESRLFCKACNQKRLS